MTVEDYTTYTEVDENNDITVAAQHIDIDTMNKNVDSYVYKDKGIDHFDGDFEHLVDVHLESADAYGLAVFWGITNDIDDFKGLRLSNKDHLSLYINKVSGEANWEVKLYERNGSGAQSDITNITYEDTWIYLKIKRDESVGTYGRIYCYIYDNSAREAGDLIATLQIDLSEKEDFRYIFAVSSYDLDQTFEITAEVENLNLQEAAGGQQLFTLINMMGY